MAQFILGRRHMGRYPLAGHWTLDTSTGTLYSQPYRPGVYSVVVYNADGTKLARFGSDMGDNPVVSLEFEINEHGCGAFSLILGQALDVTVGYGQRIDVHLFDDPLPWYSGLVLEKPLAGSTARTLEYSGHGYVCQLDNILVDQDYASTDIATVVKSIVINLVEPNTGILYRGSKIQTTGFVATGLRFQNATATEALQELCEFANNFRYGVDATREFWFKRIDTDVNESARFTVGRHLSSYKPKESIDGVLNKILVKATETEEDGSTSILATVQDATSQAAYGLREACKAIPSALTEADAQQWGLVQIARFKDPVKSAEIGGVQLWYVTPSGEYAVRRLSPEGQARITSDDGTVYGDYPISKIKYKINSNGIACSMSLGSTTHDFEAIVNNMQRQIRQAELIKDMG